MFAILRNLRLQDAVDILLLTIMVYYLYRWFRGTKAFKALVGLLALGIVYTVADFWGLFLTTWVFQLLWQVLVILLIILFQSEIRQVLERVNPFKRMGLRKSSAQADWIGSFSDVIFDLARKKIGALVIIERTERVEELVTGGQPLEADPSPSIVASIFQKDSPLHDGAVHIKEGRIAQVACYLPLSSSEGLPQAWGTRHRAALGLSERCDAWIILVSEERGEVVLAREKRLEPVSTQQRLSQLMLEAIEPLKPPPGKWWQQLRFRLLNHWPTKLLSLTLVCIVWLLLAGQQNFQVNLAVPVELKNLPTTQQVVEPVNPQVTITVRGLRKDASTLRKENVHVYLDLSRAQGGTRIFRITRDQIILNNDRLSIVAIRPTELKFEFKEIPLRLFR